MYHDSTWRNATSVSTIYIKESFKWYNIMYYTECETRETPLMSQCLVHISQISRRLTPRFGFAIKNDSKTNTTLHNAA